MSYNKLYLKTDISNGYDVPTYDCKKSMWGHTTFYSFEDYLKFIEKCFKEPGEYEFDEEYLIVNEQARFFTERGYYCNAPYKSKDYITYWSTEKNKCRKGIIIKGSSGKTWYICREYYMWLNFLPIFHKEKRQNLFPDLYDGQYHTALYEYIAELNSKHAVILKKRQYAMSYYHMAKLINQLFLERGITLKLIGFLDAYINMDGSWAFLNEYKDFLNKHTGWYRQMEPDKVGSWQQRQKVTIGGRDQYTGYKGRLIGISTQNSPTKGIGGASRYIIAEESGVNPTLDKTYGYAKSALEAGPMLTIGQFIAYGSVGDLKQCDPLQKFMLYPEQNGFYGVDSKFYNEVGIIKKCGLFIPEVWNMFPFSDKYGNSDVEGATKALLEYRVQQKKDLTPEDYQLEISQHPIWLEEAFATRSEPIFPSHLVAQQIRRIDDGDYPVQYVDFIKNHEGKWKVSSSKKLPISKFPIDKKMEDKSSVICMYEPPVSNPSFGLYFASIDPVSEGATITSESLCSIIIYKNNNEVTLISSDDVKTSYEKGKIVCTWCGRYEDINKTHDKLLSIIETYNAWTLCEANISQFINYMIFHKKQHYLVPKNQIPFLKEVGSNTTAFQDYGWKNTGKLFKEHLLSYGVEFTKEEIDHEFDKNGDIISVKYGIERIPDRMILEEMKQYRHGLNVDRIVAYCALVAFVQIYNANRGIVRVVEKEDKLVNSQKLSKLNMRSPFKHIGSNYKSLGEGSSKLKKSPFRNIR